MRICASRARYALSSLGWSIHEIIKALEDVTFQNLLDFVPQLYKKLALEMFVYGNSSPQLAMDSFENAKQTFKPSQTFGDLKERYVVKLGKLEQPLITCMTISRTPNSALSHIPSI